MNIYDFTAKSSYGRDVKLSEYKDRVMLIVNTATACGFTPQYDGLQELFATYKDKGFILLDFPCNQFDNQAPESDSEIDSFCRIRFNTTFPRFAKIEVNGSGAHPLYKYLKEQKGGDIKWNFTKFLVDKNGKVVERFDSAVTPKSIESAIQKLL